MNLAEAQAVFNLMRGLETDADEARQDKAVEAAEYLTQRANTSLAAGPKPPAIAQLVRDVQAAVEVAADSAHYVELVQPGVVTVTTREGVL